jgi:hypothetical protein
MAVMRTAADIEQAYCSLAQCTCCSLIHRLCMSVVTGKDWACLLAACC